MELAQDEPDAAYGLCQEHLRDHPDDYRALTLAGTLLCSAEKYGVAVALLERATHLAPHLCEIWNNLGTAWNELKRPKRARECFRKALEIRECALYMVHVGATFTEEGEHAEAMKWFRKAEKLEPGLPNIAAARCFSELATGDWLNGWRHWEQTLGGRFRKRLNFGGADWDGSPVERLIVYGEQGLGDEIMFGSCIEDCRALAEQVVIECDPRLEGLYRRSFPWAEVHGTRREEREWDVSCDAQVAVGSLPHLFRPSADSCPQKPYLTADPERALMWRALFDSWGKPVIGINWSGGRIASQAKKRNVGLEAFRSYIETTDAVFVSLQYKDAAEEIEASGLPVRQFSALLSDDYDDTAALVGELDGIVGIHSTVHHLAGAMGKASTILVPHTPLWNYQRGDKLPWYGQQALHRQRRDESWADCIKRFA